MWKFNSCEAYSAASESFTVFWLMPCDPTVGRFSTQYTAMLCDIAGSVDIENYEYHFSSVRWATSAREFFSTQTCQNHNTTNFNTIFSALRQS